MHNIRLLTIIFTIILNGCCNENKPTDEKYFLPNKTEKSISSPFKNPVFIYGSSFGEFFQSLYKLGKYEDMLMFTSKKSIDKFSRERILDLYRKMEFGYKIKLIAKVKTGNIPFY